MLIYAKKNADGELKLYGTLASIPAEDDSELLYDDSSENGYVYDKKDLFVDDGHGGINVVRDGKILGNLKVSFGKDGEYKFTLFPYPGTNEDLSEPQE